MKKNIERELDREFVYFCKDRTSNTYMEICGILSFLLFAGELETKQYKYLMDATLEVFINTNL